MFAGSAKVPIRGYGEVDIQVETSQSGTRILRLYDVAYCQGFACNLVSLRLLRRKGYWWDNKPPNNCLRIGNGSLTCELSDHHDQFVLEYIPQDLSRAAFHTRRNKINSWTKRAPSSTDQRTWHLRLGHPGPEALDHLVGHSQGVKMRGLSTDPTTKERITTVDCDDCGCTKIKRQIRREPRERPDKAGSRLAIDFHDFEEDKDGYTSVMLIYDRFSGYIWDFYLKDRTAVKVVEALKWLFRILDRQHQIKPEVIETDGELPKSYRFNAFIFDQGLRVEPSAPYTQDQNGGAERSGGVIKEKSRAMRLGARLPAYLMREIVRTAVYLYNRTPKWLYNWKSPYERFFTFLAYRDGVVASERRPQQAHLRVFGCKAFVMSPEAHKKRNRKQRFNPKAWIGYLVGYNSTNIYRIWNPAKNRVVIARDVIFNEKETFSGDIQHVKDDLLHIASEELEALLQRVEIPEVDDTLSNSINEDEDLYVVVGEVNTVEEGLQDSRGSSEYPEGDATQVDRDYGPGSTFIGSVEQEPSDCRTDHPTSGTYLDPYLTPEDTPPPPAALLAATIRSSAFNELEEAQDQQLLEVGESLTEALYPCDPRYSNWRTAFNAGRLVTPLGTINGETVSKARYARAVKAARPVASYPNRESHKLDDPENGSEQLMGPENGPSKLKSRNRRDLPPPPKTHRDLRTHLLGAEFRAAEKAHLQSHQESRTWTEVTRAGQQGILDSMWVYVYKFDKHGRLVKCKARLVIRGDQQSKTAQNTYASTLAGRSFRSVMAIAARFDLELIQYDVVNAFVNAELQDEVYMRLPPGYQKPGVILRLQRALYGLRQAPLLWQKHFTSTLTRIGFKPVPHEPCCYSLDGVLIFFYVDDIVLAFEKGKRALVDRISDQLKETYTLTGGESLQWFLGIEILRDRKKGLIWLSQAEYVEKIQRLADCTGPSPATPMRNKELLPYEEEKASLTSINQYQRKIGSILYAAVITRPDIAFAASRLARFNTNPGPEHHAEADRVIRYLVGTKNLALQLGGSDNFEVASDASFADNSTDRTSSQAYVMRLFGGTIGWRANKQDTVTTSTTEAELLALAQATKEALFVSRLVKELGVTLDDSRINIQCDNKQTIRLVHAEIALLQTKLRHVDIHNHWLRQEAIRKRIKVSYTPTDSMIADGLTKSLHSEQHKRFVQQMGLVDIHDLRTERKLRELSADDFDQIEDTLAGGEIEIGVEE